jgi:hypothetical protein
MNLDHSKLQPWLHSIREAFPSLIELVQKMNGRSLVIGAAVLEIYRAQGWIPVARSTGDLDLSVGIRLSVDEYDELRNALVADGYTTDSLRRYRLFSPKRATGMSYLDLLAHPEGAVLPEQAREAMGVGSDWSFEEIDFAFISAFQIDTALLVPNPIGFLGLKAASYKSDPQRVRDLVDIVDVVFGMVNYGCHFDLCETWAVMKNLRPQVLLHIESMINGIINETVEWDFRPANNEFSARYYDINELEQDAPMRFREFLEAVSHR